jgi:hypothetical protein
MTRKFKVRLGAKVLTSQEPRMGYLCFCNGISCFQLDLTLYLEPQIGSATCECGRKVCRGWYTHSQIDPAELGRSTHPPAVDITGEVLYNGEGSI